MASLVSLAAAVRRLGVPRTLLFARVNLAAYQGEAQPLGALPPKAARATYTRQARREQRQRQLSRRSGVAGLLNSLRAS